MQKLKTVIFFYEHKSLILYRMISNFKIVILYYILILLAFGIKNAIFCLRSCHQDVEL